jgi:hypothetical protein
LNTLGHVFFANLLLVLGAPSIVSPTTLIVTSLAAVITDLDHVLHLPTAMKTYRFKSETRTRWHELPGLMLAMIISTIIMLFSAPLGRSFLIGFVSHYFLDLLTRPTRPLYPLSERVVFLGLAPRNLKKLTVYDAILTVVFGAILIASLHGQGIINI